MTGYELDGVPIDPETMQEIKQRNATWGPLFLDSVEAMFDTLASIWPFTVINSILGVGRDD